MKYDIEKRKIYASKRYWLREYQAYITTGEYSFVPIRLYEGYLMVSYLRHIVNNNNLKNYSIYVQYAILRKLDQYDGVEWFYGCPTRKPKKPFNYIRQIYKYDHSEQDVSSSKSYNQSRKPIPLL